MDPRESETLIQRLVANPHDEEALAYAHRAGAQDPRAYAILLEKVGQATTDPSYSAHWLTEAANVWSTTIGDAHHAARTLMAALERDPTFATASERLAQLYREKGDTKALIALLERQVKYVAPLLDARPELRVQLVRAHEELGRLWGDQPFNRPDRALENWRRLAELDPTDIHAIYCAREMLKASQQWADALPYYALERDLVADPERKLALYRDEADVRRRAGDRAGATQALRNARTLRPDDMALAAEIGAAINERFDIGEHVPRKERDESAAIFVSLAETYDGRHGLDYSLAALKARPGNERAMQLADYYAGKLDRTKEIGPQYAAYLQDNPNGFMSEAARAKVGDARPPDPPPPMLIELPPPRPPGAAGASNPGSGGPGAAGAFAERAANTSPAGADLRSLLAEGQAASATGRKPAAYAKYRDALAIDAAQPEALAWVEDYLRQKRMYADLRDVLLAASRAPNVSPQTRKAQLRDVAGICESRLRDLETAIQAQKQITQIDRGDQQAREALRRLLEKGGRWDDLATLLEQDAMSTPDVEQKIALEKKLAGLHEHKRKDLAAAAEARARVANLSPKDETAVQTAVGLYENEAGVDMPTLFEALRRGAAVKWERASGLDPANATAAPPPAGEPADLLVVHAAADSSALLDLEKHLASLVRGDMLRIWHQGRAQPDEPVVEWLKKRADEARLVVLLVTADYLESELCYELETYALQRGHKLRVIPLILRACLWEISAFRGFDALPKNRLPVSSWSDRDEAWTDVVKGIQSALQRAGGLAQEPARHPRPAAPREPRYDSAEVRSLAERMEKARARRQRLREAGTSTEEVEQEILSLRRQIREGGQLCAGDALADGRYLLLDTLGRGGFAVVFRALDRALDRQVAIKVLHSSEAQVPSRRERFFRGARVMGELSHEGIVRVLDPHGEDAGYHYFVMELVDGEDLHRAVIARRMPRERTIPVVLRIGGALAEAHGRGIVHRDVKPSNVLIDEAGAPKLTDFDLVAVNDTTGGTRTGAMGTFLFAAPEQMENAKEADARADVFGLGMMSIFCFHGAQLPSYTLRAPDKVIAKLPCSEPVRQVLTRAIELDPSQRFDDAGQFCAALRAAAPKTPQMGG